MTYLLTCLVIGEIMRFADSLYCIMNATNYFLQCFIDDRIS